MTAKSTRRQAHERSVEMSRVWTQIAPRLLRLPGVAERFVYAAPVALERMLSALRYRDSLLLTPGARELLQLTESIGARGLSALVIAVRADSQMGDWLVADARARSIAPYLEAVLQQVAQDKLSAPAQPTPRYLNERSASLPIQRAVASVDVDRRSAVARAAV